MSLWKPELAETKIQAVVEYIDDSLSTACGMDDARLNQLYAKLCITGIWRRFAVD
jgi:hypothetical protein